MYSFFYRAVAVPILLISVPFSTAWAQQDLPDLPTDSKTELVESGLQNASETSVAATAAKKIDTDKLYFSGEVPTSVEELRLMEKHFAELAEQVKPATVNIQIQGAQGSGVVISEDGYILTAAHVIGVPNQTATITFPDGKEVLATTLGTQNNIDSGMLKINEDQGDDWPYLEIGLSSDLKEGQWVMAIGHPGGRDEARGLVVRVGRIIFRNSRVVRTDCTLVGGDSGGPLVNMKGEVIAIHSRIGAQLWNNIHVPIDTYSENWDELAEGIILDGQPGLGFDVVGSTAIVESVSENSAAAKGGLKAGDIIKKIGRVEIEDKQDISLAISRLKPFMKTKIMIERGGKDKTLKIVVGTR